MSNRRRLHPPRSQHPVSAYMAALDGAQIPGGGDDCGTYQTVTAHGYGPRVVVATTTIT